VVSFGPLGVLGRTGWFCREADVDRWNALAGYRGLRDPDVLRHFNGTFLAFDRSWGDEELRMTKLDLRYDVAYLGATAAADAIRARLDAGLATFFYLWSPHPLSARYSLNRIQLPAYTPELFELGLSDYPTDVLEKVATKTLSEQAPDVAKVYSLFRIDNPTQEGMLAAIDSGLSAMQATCAWMRKEENVAVWEALLPVSKLYCDPGNYAMDESSCAPCPAGSASVGGAVSKCTSCSAGTPAEAFIRPRTAM
jgi:glycine betaine/proline transport system substrate-binding protein